MNAAPKVNVILSPAGLPLRPRNDFHQHVLVIVEKRLENNLSRDLYNEWTIELKGMADRIISMRQQLFDALRSRGLPLLNFLCNLFCLYLSVWSCFTIVSPIYQTFLFTHSLLLKK
ncbi:uncharacterized protein LOC130723093 [Lotus japonicus]|uniref:uncharacterized protein LOC130723093 n=1 Tax=Lotus japonicus TaxID=34305 RepID=UPI002587ADCA|nr:uncharacterized protein LOC130723093 [Lotus japonicus]